MGVLVSIAKYCSTWENWDILRSAEKYRKH